MSSLIIVSASMHKITSVNINVRYRQPVNVVAYISITFEVYKNGTKFFAIPLTSDENKILANLPNEFSFRLEEDNIYISHHGVEEVTNELVDKLTNLGFIKLLKDKYSEKARIYLAERLEFY